MKGEDEEEGESGRKEGRETGEMKRIGYYSKSQC